MIPHICRVTHNPPASYGDCMRAAVASILNVEDMETVPHFMMNGDPETSDMLMREYLLQKHGLKPFAIALPGVVELDNILSVMAQVNAGVPFLLFHNSGGDDHVVICMNDKVIHDPAPFPGAISGPMTDGQGWGIMVFVPNKY